MSKVKVIIASVLTLAVFGGLVGYRVSEKRKLEAQIKNIVPPATAVTVIKPIIGNISEFFSTSGTIVASSEVQVMPKVSGRILSLFVEEGSKVNAGQLIAQIEHNELDAQILQSKAQLSIAQSNFQLLVNGPLKTQITQSQAAVKQSEYNVSQIKVNLSHSKSELERYKKLLAQSAITKQQYDNYETQTNAIIEQYEAAKQQVISAKASLKALIDGNRVEQISGGRGQVSQASASIKILETQLSNYTIKAPISGVVTKKSLEQGSMATPSSSIVTLSDTSNPEIEMNIPEKQILNISLDQVVEMKSSAFPDKTIKVKIKEISPIVDTQTRLVKVKASINSDLPLKIGMMFDCQIILRENNDSILLPGEALLTEGNKTYVYIAKNNKVEEKIVKVGIQRPEEVQIIDGLEGNEDVITKGNVFVKSGDRIQTQKAVNVVKVD
ncbi:MAG: efflux RND transporter periplasmic adaptor subunit [Candidatus Sericytochromatia bacterium]